MGYKTIESMIHFCEELLAAFKLHDTAKAKRRLNQLEEYNLSEFGGGKEFNITFLLNLHGNIEEEITKIKKNMEDHDKNKQYVVLILSQLNKVTDQRKVRDKIITEVIHPLFKRWGYKKEARSFRKEEGGYSKKVNIFTSQFVDYYNVEFIFEISIEGQGQHYLRHRVKEKWFKLTEDTDLGEIKAEIEAHLTQEIKPFLDRFK